MHNPLCSTGPCGLESNKNVLYMVSRTYLIDGNGNVLQETWETVNDINYSIDHG